jgi:nucleotide-binding universal stress UspA family protein
MFTKILIALDGSDHAHKALRTAAQLASRCDAELILVHALQLRSLRTDYEAIVSESVRDAYLSIGKEQADAILSHAEEEAHQLGATNVRRVMRVGEPVENVLKIAQASDVDIIVVGTRGLTGLRELALGSVAHKLTAMAHCPVLVVR